jgi:hypothetical protein
MSFDLAVWEGPRPASKAKALAEYQRLMDGWQTPDAYGEPSPAIRRYVDTLLAKWPDTDTDAGEGSPWTCCPLISNASGSLVYLTLEWKTPPGTIWYCALTATEQGLICFDPQNRRVLRYGRPQGG